MTPATFALLLAAVVGVAFLYSSVGHAGASGYIAVMSLFGLAPEVIRPTALAMNVLVASVATWQFWRSGHLSWRLFWPFALLAVPCAFLGGAIALPARLFDVLLGAILIASAVWLARKPPSAAPAAGPTRPAALGIGAGIGLVAGLTGTGGGIFLTPILILRKWAVARTAAAVTAPFVLVNSLAGLAGNVASTRHFPPYAFSLLVAAGVGGLLGSYAGGRRLSPAAIERILALVLLLAGAKLLLAT